MTRNTDGIALNDLAFPRWGMQTFGAQQMRKEPSDQSARPRNYGRVSLSARLETVRYLCEISSSCRAVPTQAIADALVAAGYISLDEQAKALGLRRSTTWTIIRKKHKLGRLNRQTAQRILKNRTTPPSVRAIIQKTYLEKIDVAALQSKGVNK